MAAAASGAIRPAGHGAQGPAEVTRETCGDHAAAVDVGLDHDHHAHETRDDAVALRERLPVRRPAEREFGEHAAVGLHPRAEAHRFRGEGEVESVADDRRGAAGGVQRAFVRRGVDPAGQAADDPPALLCEVARERPRQRSPVGRAVPRADDADRALGREVPAFGVEHERRIPEPSQRHGPRLVVLAEQAEA